MTWRCDFSERDISPKYGYIPKNSSQTYEDLQYMAVREEIVKSRIVFGSLKTVFLVTEKKKTNR